MSTRLPAVRDQGVPRLARHGPRTGRSLVGPRPPDIQRVGPMLRRRRWSIVWCTILVVLTTAVVTWLWPRTYKSSTTFLVEKQGGQESPALDVLERLGAVGQIQTEINLLSSRSVVEPVVDDLALHVTVLAEGEQRRPSDVFPVFTASRDAPAGDYRVVGGVSGRWQVHVEPGDSLLDVLSPDSISHFAGLDLQAPRSLDASDLVIRVVPFPLAVEQTQRRITAALVNREADLIELTCKGGTPETAQQVCDGISRSYMRLRTDLQRADAAATATFLRDQVGRLGAQLRSVEDSIAAYSRRHQVVALDTRASAETQQDIDVQAQRDQLVAEHDALQNLIRGIDSSPGTSKRFRDLAGYPALLKNEAVTGLLSSLNDQENRRVDLALRRTEQNADLAAVDTRIADIERQLHAIASSYEQGLAMQIRSLDGTQSQLSRRLAAIPEEQVQSARLERERSAIEDVWQMLQTRLQEAEVAEAVKLPSVRIVDAASLPYKAASPRVPLNLALGLLMGLGAGVALAILRELRDSRLHERVEVERTVGLPVLAVIPRLSRPGPVLQAFTEHQLPPRREHRSTRALRDANVTLEAFRALAVDLKFSGGYPTTGGPIAIAVTSSTHGEGKTMTACNLALTRASQGVQTLLIDADIRGSGVASFFRSPSPNYGLSDLLAGSADFATVCTRLRVADRNALSIIPAGSPTPHSAELLESPEMGQLLDQAKAQYDLIVIDTPPLMGVTDAAAIAAMVDGVILVVRGGVTDREALELTLRRIARVNGQVLGVVFNAVRGPEGDISRHQYAEAARAGGVR
ncbi:MAG TPA: polysaccharide biosynthesis tyrosine autokinase [Gemmatimonadales bacterium]|nr:polysaccharide biosynthesis tyrosine autokinase [Gemmatimonadales bacterium]